MKLILRWCCFWYTGADSHGHTSGAFWPWGTSEKCQHFPEQQSIDTLLCQAWWFHENLKRVLLYSSTTSYCGYIQFVLQLSSLYLCIWKRASCLCWFSNLLSMLHGINAGCQPVFIIASTNGSWCSAQCHRSSPTKLCWLERHQSSEEAWWHSMSI